MRRSTRASTAASLLRGQNPKGRSVRDRTACAASSVQVLGVSASASCGAQIHKGPTQMASKAQKLIGGTAIRNLANRPRFSDLQISNRQQKGAKEMRHIAGIGGADMQLAPNARTITRHRPLPQFLIANPRLEFSSNNRKQTHLKISNRERMAISAVTRTAAREQSRVAESTARPKGSARPLSFQLINTLPCLRVKRRGQPVSGEFTYAPRWAINAQAN